ncbi:hypothetical protein J3R30DRAFT_740365 [Lentinula aciculospora]|uniref:Uncharacterized protein n=1 Tax=Lentinula aciculospora TaxID=153920 RepID=A0A9W9A3V3_9AGAR|nr:hypothetical protein J3R30DRAFT_740365 [Lentinula aciculospora]
MFQHIVFPARLGLSTFYPHMDYPTSSCSTNGADVDSRASVEMVTCSLASTRMLPNQTCDDLPGAGRTVDTYFYQTAERFLEHRINKILEKRRSREKKRQSSLLQEQMLLDAIDSTEAAVHSFFESKFLTVSEGHALVCNHKYWTGSGLRYIRLDLSEYLYIWGAQDIEGWDDQVVAECCARISDYFVRPCYSLEVKTKAQMAAICYDRAQMDRRE